MKKLWHVYIMNCYSAVKISDIKKFAGKRMELEKKKNHSESHSPDLERKTWYVLTYKWVHMISLKGLRLFCCFILFVCFWSEVEYDWIQGREKAGECCGQDVKLVKNLFLKLCFSIHPLCFNLCIDFWAIVIKSLIHFFVY